MRLLPRAALALCALAPAAWLAARAPGGDEAAAAHALLATLDPELAERALLGFDSPHRLDWHYVPRDRAGVELGDLDDSARRALHGLLSSALSSRGYLEATGVIELEGILQELQSTPERPATWRDPGRYTLALHAGDGTGGLGAGEPWAFSLEGHHLSLNFTYLGPEAVGSTPLFIGAQPHEVRAGPRAGWKLLGGREHLGRELVRSLDEAQLERALLSGRPPADVVHGPGRDELEATAAGIPASELTPEQQERLWLLIREFVEVLRPERAAEELERIRAGFDQVRFAWSGPLEARSRHYYRVQGRHFALEYDSVSPDGDHVHTVWRDFERDFGRDPLRRHHERAHRKEPGVGDGPADGGGDGGGGGTRR